MIGWLYEAKKAVTLEALVYYVYDSGNMSNR